MTRTFRKRRYNAKRGDIARDIASRDFSEESEISRLRDTLRRRLERHAGSGEDIATSADSRRHYNFSGEPETSRYCGDIKISRRHRDIAETSRHRGDIKISRRHRRDIKISRRHRRDIKISRRHQDIAETSRHRGDIKRSRRHREIAETSRYRGDIKRSRRHRDIAETSRYRGDIAASAENREVTSVMSAKVDNNVNLRHEPAGVTRALHDELPSRWSEGSSSQMRDELGLDSLTRAMENAPNLFAGMPKDMDQTIDDDEWKVEDSICMRVRPTGPGCKDCKTQEMAPRRRRCYSRTFARRHLDETKPCCRIEAISEGIEGQAPRTVREFQVFPGLSLAAEAFG